MTIRQKLENTENIISDENISVPKKQKAENIMYKIKELIKNGYHFDDDFEIAEKIEKKLKTVDFQKETENGCS